MDSNKAAAVRDAINGCPTVVNDDNLVERDKEPRELRGINNPNGNHIRTGNRVDTKRCKFKPAYIEQCGTIANGDGQKRPVYVVILKTLWTKNDEVRSMSKEMVHEIAKHGCKIRYYPPEHRLDGDIWITDHLDQVDFDNNEERCQCGSKYFKIVDGETRCAKCGEKKHEANTENKITNKL